ncbi:MAG: hypothetical protein E7Z91_00135 [Cyanobacteria bacterium SIG30]|nr:hypothetical protein [Cyanobacteria bacterium SIG30]
MMNSPSEIIKNIIIFLILPFLIIVFVNIKNFEKQAPSPEKSIEEIQSAMKDVKVDEKPVSSYSKYITQDEMQSLQNAISRINTSRTNDPQEITNIFLETMGYPKYLVEVKYFKNNGSNFEGDIQAGMFEYPKGVLSLNQDFIKYANRGSVIGVIRHELDHFDKGAKINKSIGINNFKKLWPTTFNEEFWVKASIYADTTGFDSKKYLSGLNKYTSTTDITSLYQTFVDKSDGVRNPLELSAYAFSDYIEEYYGVRKENHTNLKRVAIAFNKVDWQIYKIANDNEFLSRSRAAIFDYYFLRAMMKTDPILYKTYENATKSGDFSEFRQKCNQIAYELQNNNVDITTSNNLVSLFSIMETDMNQRITDEQISKIFYYKYMSLKNALKDAKYKDFVGNILIVLDINVDDYLNFIESKSIEDEELKLKLLTSKFWLSQYDITQPDGSVMRLGQNGETEKVAKEISKNKIFQKEQKASGENSRVYLVKYLNKNKVAN